MSRIVQPKNFFSPLVKKHSWRQLKKTEENSYSLQITAEKVGIEINTTVICSFLQLFTDIIVMFK